MYTICRPDSRINLSRYLLVFPGMKLWFTKQAFLHQHHPHTSQQLKKAYVISISMYTECTSMLQATDAHVCCKKKEGMHVLFMIDNLMSASFFEGKACFNKSLMIMRSNLLKLNKALHK